MIGKSYESLIGGNVKSASVIVVSDRVYSGERPDKAGEIAEQLLTAEGFSVEQRVVIPEGREAVEAHIASALDAGVALVVTCGGTGVRPRNLTPEATEGFISTRLFGLEQLVLMEGLHNTRHAAMSRGIIGFTSRSEGGSLIVNAPGSRGGVEDTLRVVLEFWPRLSEGLTRH